MTGCLLVGLAGCGGGTVATVTVTDTVTAAPSSPAAASTLPSATHPSGHRGSATADPTAAAVTSAPPSAGPPSTTASTPASAAAETILTVRLEAYDPATGTLTFVPQDLVDTVGDTTAVLSDPAQSIPSTATVTAQTNVRFTDQGRDISAAIAAGKAYCNMVLEGNQVTWLWELHAT